MRSGPISRRVPLGLYRDITLKLDFNRDFQFYVGLAERENHPWLRKLSKGVRTAVDVGADRGEQTLYLALRTPASRVFAIEPSGESLAWFHDNLRLNSLEGNSRVVLTQRFAGSADSGKFITLDTLLGDEAEPIFVKMDIEGAEVDALKGASRTLGRADVRWLIEVHSKAAEAFVLETFASHGYSVRNIPQAAWRSVLPEMRSKDNRWVAAWKPRAERS